MKTTSNQESFDLPFIDSLWNYNDPAETALKFEALIDTAKSRDENYYLELMTQIARTQSLQMNFDSAHIILDQIESQLTADKVIPTIRYNLERGRTYNSANKKERASEFFTKAYNLALANNQDFYTIDAAHMLAISEPAEKQLEWNLIALEHTEKTEDFRAKKWQGSLYNNIGWTYHDGGEFEKALIYFEKALAYREGKNDQEGVFIAKWTIARTYRSLGKIDEAINLQEQLMKEMTQEGGTEDGYVYEELGECYYTIDPVKAKPYFKKAFDLLSQDQWMVANESVRLERLKQLGN
ncbi:MAG: tetratricopeptide repeat protein [Chitinophagales bacterium]